MSLSPDRNSLEIVVSLPGLPGHSDITLNVDLPTSHRGGHVEVGVYQERFEAQHRVAETELEFGPAAAPSEDDDGTHTVDLRLDEPTRQLLVSLRDRVPSSIDRALLHGVLTSYAPDWAWKAVGGTDSWVLLQPGVASDLQLWLSHNASILDLTSEQTQLVDQLMTQIAEHKHFQRAAETSP
jgi:hypothetical protein